MSDPAVWNEIVPLCFLLFLVLRFLAYEKLPRVFVIFSPHPRPRRSFLRWYKDLFRLVKNRLGCRDRRALVPLIPSPSLWPLIATVPVPPPPRLNRKSAWLLVAPLSGDSRGTLLLNPQQDQDMGPEHPTWTPLPLLSYQTRGLDNSWSPASSEGEAADRFLGYGSIPLDSETPEPFLDCNMYSLQTFRTSPTPVGDHHTWLSVSGHNHVADHGTRSIGISKIVQAGKRDAERRSRLSDRHPTGWMLLQHHSINDFAYLALADLQHVGPGLRFWLWEDEKQGTDDEAFKRLTNGRNSWCDGVVA